MMIDIFYLWGEKWMTNYEQNQHWGYWLICATILFYAGTFTLNFYSFSWFTSQNSFNSFVLSLNLIFIVVISLISVSGIARNGSLLTSGGVFLYETFILWTGLANSPKESNDFNKSHSPLNFEIFFGCLIIVVSIAYVSFNQAYFGEKNEASNQNDLEKEPIIQNNNGNNNNNNNQISQENESLPIYTKTNLYVYFHIIMMSSTFYLAMLFTNWGAPDLTQKIVFSYTPNLVKYWIQIVFSWTIVGVYIWTLVAPKILTNREFD